MDSAKTPCEMDLLTAWQAEGALVQVLMFSLLLVTLAITFQHLSYTDYISMHKTGALVMAVVLSVVAVFFAIVGVISYSSRLVKMRSGCGTESLIHCSFVVLAVLVICIEIAFMTATFIVTTFHERIKVPDNPSSSTEN